MSGLRHKRNTMSDQITVYEKPTCTKCREMDRFLRESGVDFDKVNYYIEPLSEKKLRELIKKKRSSHASYCAPANRSIANSKSGRRI